MDYLQHLGPSHFIVNDEEGFSPPSLLLNSNFVHAQKKYFQRQKEVWRIISEFLRIGKIEISRERKET
jgi:hypothetical protein